MVWSGLEVRARAKPTTSFAQSAGGMCFDCQDVEAVIASRCVFCAKMRLLCVGCRESTPSLLYFCHPCCRYRKETNRE